MKWQLQNAYVKSYQVNGTSDDADTFDFVSAEERGETESEGHKEWIPILSVSQGINRSTDTANSEEVTLNYEKIEWTYHELDTSNGTEPMDTFSDFG